MELLNQQFFTILKLDKDFAFELSGKFEKTILDILQDFELALNELNSDKCKKLMHTAKGCAANFGAEELTNNFRLLESEVYNLNKDEVIIFKEKVALIKKLLNQTLIEVGKYK